MEAKAVTEEWAAPSHGSGTAAIFGATYLFVPVWGYMVSERVSVGDGAPRPGRASPLFA